MAEQKLIQKRKTIKASLTKMSNFANSFEPTNDIHQIVVRNDKIEDLWTNYDIVQSELEDIDATQSADRDVVEDLYFNVKAAFKKILILYDGKQKQETFQRDAATPMLPTNDALENVNTVKLPQLHIPIFTGNYHDWINFYDVFTAVIDNNKRLSQVEKLYYLKTHLKGEAIQIINALPASNENYPVALQLLKERYDNKVLIANHHMREIFEQSTLNFKDNNGLRHLVTNTKQHLRSLKSLDLPTEHWDIIIMYVICQKLDIRTRQEWEIRRVNKNMPSLAELFEFLENRCSALECITGPTTIVQKQPTSHMKNIRSTNQQFSYANTGSKGYYTCPICNEAHGIYVCDKFLGLSFDQRTKAVQKAGLCYNCLRGKHAANQCQASSCKKCSKKHNTLLHPNDVTTEVTTSTNCNAQTRFSQVLLSTAVIDILDFKGQPHPCRVLLDSGSQSNFISENMIKRLHLPQTTINMPVSGLNQLCTNIKCSTNATIKSRYSSYKTNLNLLVLPKITEELPSHQIRISDIAIPDNIILADSKFYQKSEIDMLIGIEIFYSILCDGQIETPQGLTFRKSQFGWLIAGKIYSTQRSKQPNKTSCHLAIDPLSDQIHKFWEIEECDTRKVLSWEEAACEEHFRQTITRDNTGRYIAKLPFKDNKGKLGDSHGTALKRFNALERRFTKNPSLRTQYSEFMREYIHLGHMKEAPREAIELEYYLPHHAVMKEASLTTKLRVVFDGSASTTTGTSLNDTLMVGTTIQEDLVSILTRFRLHTFVLTADIEKMYRQVQIHEDDSHFQKILWRPNQNEAIKTYQLMTVTYGTASAPFIATRCLQQLADDESHNYPLASSILKRDFYVDDVLTGANTINETIQIKNDLTELLRKGGFHLRKWASNNSNLLQDSNTQSNVYPLQLDSSETIKTLGLHWNSCQDTIVYEVNLTTERNTTKRTILAQIARLFDPLGLLGPIIVKAKIIMQELWKLKTNWDESVPIYVFNAWSEYKQQLSSVNQLAIKRNIIISNAINIQLHGFCDASEKAYGACIYVRSTDGINTQMSLVCSKSRVSPLKNITLPRLELCSSVLLAKLYKTTAQSLGIKFDRITFWTDSTIALCWISTPAHTLKTFVANRVAEIQSLTDSRNWKHISSQANPADIISRGLLPSQIQYCKLWWNGPSWIIRDENTWPCKEIPLDDIPEVKSATTVLIVTNKEANFSLLTKYSDFSRLLRITAYCLRFINRMRNKRQKTGPILAEELEEATVTLIRAVQCHEFKHDMHQLERNGRVDNKSNLLRLNPFLDKDKVLRVGGRLKHSVLSEFQKYPILLPNGHHLTKIIIRHEHVKCLHAGVQATLYAVRIRYWPLNGRNMTRKIVHNCITCFKVKPTITEHLMSDLPSSRTTVSRPFTHTGIDYCGPFYIKDRRRGKRNHYKVYVSVFICFTVKAIHLELVSDLTTEAFISALRRFISRRGLPRHMYSDNATNFTGAAQELEELMTLFNSQLHKNKVMQFMAEENIMWHFIPPRSPHFGGLWEAAVKSFKHHLRRVVGKTILTFEELNSVIIEIESILNSRPLTPMSSDPNDFSVLTPGHFLLGDSLTGLADPDLRTIQTNRLSKWQQIQLYKQQIWARWYKEYLNELNVRSKWQTQQENLQIGRLVLLVEDNIPPMRWLIGRIVSLHPGTDGVVRVVTVKTTTSSFKRAVRKVCPLPIDNNNES